MIPFLKAGGPNLLTGADAHFKPCRKTASTIDGSQGCFCLGWEEDITNWLCLCGTSCALLVE